MRPLFQFQSIPTQVSQAQQTLKHSSSVSSMIMTSKNQTTTNYTTSILTNNQNNLNYNTLKSNTFPKQIQAQSSSSIDIKCKQKQDLIMKILMMSFQIQRKDNVVKNLLKQLQSISSKLSLLSKQQQYKQQKQINKYKKYNEELQYQNNQYKIKIKQLESININKIHSYHREKQLEEKIIIIERKCKEIELKKIQIQSEYQKIITQNKMINYQLVNIQSTQKAKNRQIKNQIEKITHKLQQQKRINNQLKIYIESKNQQIKSLTYSFNQSIRQYEQRIKSLQKQLSHKQDLKKSQIFNSQQQMQMSKIQSHRMQQQIHFLRKKIDQQNVLYQKKQQNLINDIKRIPILQSQLFHLKHQNTSLSQQIEQKSIQLNNYLQQLNNSKQKLTELQSLKCQYQLNNQTYEHKTIILKQQNQNYKTTILRLQNQIQHYKSQNRKLKRQKNNNIATKSTNQCKSCKLIQSNVNQRKNLQFQTLNLNQIIEQTEKLHHNAIKIDSLLNKSQLNVTQSMKKININSLNYSIDKPYDSRVSLDQKGYFLNEEH